MLIYASKSLGQLPHWAFERPTLRVVAPKMVTTHQGMRVKSQMLDESSRLQKFLGFSWQVRMHNSHAVMCTSVMVKDG
jgi:hypothetical protein